MSSVLVRGAEVAGRVLDVRLSEGVVVEVAPELRPARDDEQVVQAGGGALLPGLHDHHLHLLAMAAARESVDCSRGFAALADAPGRGWIRGVGARESVDRQVLDRVVPDRPVRVQHASGALWMLNTRALSEVASVLDDSPDVERDRFGDPTGRLWRYDARLLPALPPSDRRAALDDVVERLRSYGIGSVTDATPDLRADAVALLESLRIPVTALGDPNGAAPWKIVIADHDLPTLPALVAAIRRARAQGRPVALHVVTREALFLALAALDEVGRVAGDRLEHAAVVPDAAAVDGLMVVTQPGFVHQRGDEYLRTVAADDLPFLYRFGTLVEAGVDTVASSDAPYGPDDPWRVIEAAVRRRTSGGVVLGRQERVAPAVALAGYLRDASGRPRRIRVGERTAAVLLDAPLAEVLSEPSAERVRAVI